MKGWREEGRGRGGNEASRFLSFSLALPLSLTLRSLSLPLTEQCVSAAVVVESGFDPVSVGTEM